MLRRLSLKDSWRSFDTNFWPDELPLGQKTVIYGHNGSGKSTFSELLLSLAEGEAATDVIWEDDAMHSTKVDAGETAPSPSIAVFTRKWVEANLSAFLEGRNASAIVTLGKEAIDAKEEQDKLTVELAELQDEAEEASKRQVVSNSRVDEIARTVQDQIVSQLKAFDYVHFTKNRYTAPKVKDELRNYQGTYPDNDAHAEALKRLNGDTPSVVASVSTPPSDFVIDLNRLTALLDRTPTRIAIQALEGSPTMQTWVEEGVSLHQDVDHCYFCAGKLDDERRNQLARHFDESWLKIRSEAKVLLEATSKRKRVLESWLASLPEGSDLADNIQPAYNDAFQLVKADIDWKAKTLESIEIVLLSKATDPGTTPEAPDCSALSTDISATGLVNAVMEHNDLAKRYAEVTAGRKQTVLDHLVGSQAEAFRLLEEEASAFAAQKAKANAAAVLVAGRLDEVRQAQFTTKDMADTLTRDLTRVYGKDHLNVIVTPDGKSYACRRGNEPGTDLSDGERTTLALLYFLRRLHDEQDAGTQSSERIVVIDDPSSSLDREAIFATHQWLIDTLKDFGQYIILTHDFSLLRLFLKSHKNAWGKSMSQIRRGDADETIFPKVSFLEMYAASRDGERSSKLGKLPRILLNSTSEYAYLFSMVMAGISDSEDHERLFLLPNAVRRVLEVFASYKAPHRTDFQQQLEVLVGSQEGEPFRDVYDFCNRYSHGEGSESVDVLDARAVHVQIRRCMEFLRSVDGEHFERMCTATGVDPTTIA